jgi:hypothetical protein
MSISLRTLSDRIAKQINVDNNDVNARYLPNQREIQKLANVSLDILVSNFESIKTIGSLRKLKKTQLVFEETLAFINSSVKEKGVWSFWHHSGLCLISCFAYVELLKKNKHQTINLSDEKNWADPNWEIAVLTTNYIAGRLYPSSLAKLMQIGEGDDVNISDLCNVIVKKIEILTD